jgi:hypothetical protein
LSKSILSPVLTKPSQTGLDKLVILLILLDAFKRNWQWPQECLPLTKQCFLLPGKGMVVLLCPLATSPGTPMRTLISYSGATSGPHYFAVTL